MKKYPFIGVCQEIKMSVFDAETENRINKIRTFYEHIEFYEVLVGKYPEQRLSTDKRGEEKNGTFKRLVKSTRSKQGAQIKLPINKKEQLGFF